MLKYPHLFEPLKIGKIETKNRIFMPPLSTNLGKKGYVTDELVEHYKARAKGGVGLFITEVVTVEPIYTYLPGDMSIYDDSFIEGWKKLSDGVHEYGAKILPQLFHPAYMAFPIPGTPQLIAPSTVGPAYLKQPPRSVTVEELKGIIKQFGDAAYRAKLAGCDGVEIHAAHAHGLLGGFLSPLYNKRTDEYGGDIHARLKLTLEVIEEVRKRCGEDFVIDVRISGDEYQDGALNLNDMIYVAKLLEQAGIDMLHVSGGTTGARGSSIPAPGTSMGTHAHASEEIKKYVKIPVLTVGRIIEPWIAEEMIANNKCDAVLVGRANLCDPEFVNKAYNNDLDDIRPCIGCLRCLNGIMFGKPIACTVNPSFGLENEETLKPSKTKKNILVIGGGPSGMESAIVCAKRGHHVVLIESKSELGGQLRLASVPIAKQDLTKVIKYQIHQCKKAGVEIRLNTTFDETMLENEFKGYEVIISNGAKPIIFDDFKKFKHTLTADEILEGKANAGRKVVIIGGGSVGAELADYLAPVVHDLYPRNREVTIIEMTKGIMANETGPGRSFLMKRIMSKGIEMICEAKVTRVDETNIYYEKNAQEYKIKDADTLVFAIGYRNDTMIKDILDKHDVPYHIVGDSQKVGNLKDAISSAYEECKII